MARKGRQGKRPQPVQPKKELDMTLRIPKPKVRSWGRQTQVSQTRSQRARAVRRGSSRCSKHKGQRNW